MGGSGIGREGGEVTVDIRKVIFDSGERIVMVLEPEAKR